MSMNDYLIGDFVIYGGEIGVFLREEAGSPIIMHGGSVFALDYTQIHRPRETGEKLLVLFYIANVLGLEDRELLFQINCVLERQNEEAKV